MSVCIWKASLEGVLTQDGGGLERVFLRVDLGDELLDVRQILQGQEAQL